MGKLFTYNLILFLIPVIFILFLTTGNDTLYSIASIFGVTIPLFILASVVLFIVNSIKVFEKFEKKYLVLLLFMILYSLFITMSIYELFTSGLSIRALPEPGQYTQEIR